ncbi:ubiquitin carboxyl-terminal hydrolase 16 [Geosmithia morbida]|uniref:Ubiquitin carboxyl-terminal hydrolase n=1 Tax=Geosmithia morbida TaxID=1094350 RepID=A0A9P4YXZ3_9HYPO|nr:ubiquitin carboxyl-terminal hydrolase 16 [Geosmithia morbida]KAF4124105.1 ubiquitin carboxyl-terminal hydrolase 16 [Geosmithia morbida]
MTSKSGTVAYAAGASLAAVALVYVFGPTFALDNDDGTKSSRKKTIVGLRNAANDCFINSVLQALAGLDDLRVYLIRETHRRHIEDPAVYAQLVQPHGSGAADMAEWKIQGLQEGLLTFGLKEMIDALNERPIYKKSISPFPLVRVLETAFRQRISRQQQDAQEFLQIIAERLKDEYHAGRRARQRARTYGITASDGSDTSGSLVVVSEVPDLSVEGVDKDKKQQQEKEEEKEEATEEGDGRLTSGRRIPRIDVEEDAFPMEGKYESQLQCTTCRYLPKPREETFCTLTLAVPQVPSTSLASCFDAVFKTEYIDDFKCDKCRLLQARENLEKKRDREGATASVAEAIAKLTHAIDTDPEHPPAGVDLGDGDGARAPRRRISKTTRITIFPQILAVHLSRSIYGGGATMTKNSAKVSFPEHLPLGGIAADSRRRYKLLGVVTHKGGHNSGHYEAFRRQSTHRPPFANVDTFRPSDIYSRTPTPASTPEMLSAARKSTVAHNNAAPANLPSPAVSTPDLVLGGTSSSPSVSAGDVFTPSLESTTAQASTGTPPPRRSVPPPSSINNNTNNNSSHDTDSGSLRSVAASTKSAFSRLAAPPRSRSSQDGMGTSSGNKQKQQQSHPPSAKKRKSLPEKWWRVSDEKVRECKTSELLGMQREVYLLFYELEKDS